MASRRFPPPWSVKKLTLERKTIATCSPCPIRSFGLSGRPAPACQLPIEKRGIFLVRGGGQCGSGSSNLRSAADLQSYRVRRTVM